MLAGQEEAPTWPWSSMALHHSTWHLDVKAQPALLIGKTHSLEDHTGGSKKSHHWHLLMEASGQHLWVSFFNTTFTDEAVLTATYCSRASKNHGKNTANYKLSQNKLEQWHNSEHSTRQQWQCQPTTNMSVAANNNIIGKSMTVNDSLQATHQWQPVTAMTPNPTKANISNTDIVCMQYWHWHWHPDTNNTKNDDSINHKRTMIATMHPSMQPMILHGTRGETLPQMIISLLLMITVLYVQLSADWSTCLVK